MSDRPCPAAESEGSHPERIAPEQMMVQKLESMQTNPLERGYVDEPVHSYYSSAWNCAGLLGLIGVKMNWRDEPVFISRREPRSRGKGIESTD